MSNKIRVKSTAGKMPDGGFKVAIFERDERHPDGELFIGDDEVHEVIPTAGVRAAMVDGRLKEVRGSGDADEKTDDEGHTLSSLMSMTRDELDSEANRVGVEEPEGMKTKEDVARAILAKEDK